MPRQSSIRKSRRSTAGRSRILGLLERLRAFYGALPAPPPLPFAVYVWEVLSIGTTPSRRDAAFGALKRLPALTPDAVGRLPQAKIEAAVALAGPRRDERVRALRAGADLFRRDPSLASDLEGSLRRAVRAARRLPHLGRPSALRVLLFSRGHAVLPLDEHAHRVAQRLGYGEADGPPARTLRSTRRAVLRESGRDPATLRGLSQFLTHHGIATCTDAAPHCSVCPVAADCAWIKLQ